MFGDARKPLPVQKAQRLFGVALGLVTVATFLALGGIARAQAICHNDTMAEWWTPGYAAFIAQSEPVKKWTCAWYQLAEWWALGCQLTLWLSMTISWYNGFLVRHAMPLFAHGAASTALCGIACWFLIDNGNYYTGYAYTLGAIAFAGFAMVTIFNGFMGTALAELIFAQKCAARALKAAARGDLEAQHLRAPSDTPSSISLVKEEAGQLDA